MIVVDNGSVDGSADALSEQAGIALLRNERNLGFAAAVNQAFRGVERRVLLLLNSDVTLTSDALNVLARFLVDHPAAAGVGPLYTNPDGSPQPFRSASDIATTLSNGSSLVRRSRARKRTAPSRVPDARRRFLTTETGASAFGELPAPTAVGAPARADLRRALPDLLNDVQLARSLADQGLELWVTPDAVAVHDAHASGFKLPPAAKRRQYVGAGAPASNKYIFTQVYTVWLYRAIILIQTSPSGLSVGRTRSRGRDLLAALHGNPGPLPVQPLGPATLSRSAGGSEASASGRAAELKQTVCMSKRILVRRTRYEPRLRPIGSTTPRPSSSLGASCVNGRMTPELPTAAFLQHAASSSA